MLLGQRFTICRYYTCIYATLAALTIAGQFATCLAADGPQVLLANPLVVARGETSTVVLRGLKLDEAAAVIVSLPSGKTEVAPTKKEKSNPPDKQEAYRVGDTFVEFSLNVPADLDAKEIELAIKKGDEVSASYRIAVIPADQIVKEQEPNGGFRQTQPLSPGKTLVGSIQGGADVDVFELEALAGQTYTWEVIARARGSACDPILTLYSAQGQILATAGDDGPNSPTRLTWKATGSGRLILVLQDATDRGGPAHPYLLKLENQ